MKLGLEHEHHESTYQENVQNNLETVLKKFETYYYSLAMGLSSLGQNIRCPENVERLIFKAKNITSNIHLNFKNFTQNIRIEDLNFENFKRMVSIDKINEKVSQAFHKIIEDQNNPEVPDTSFSSYFDNIDTMMNDVTRIPLYIHMFSAIVCLLCSAVFHLFYCHSHSTSQILSRLDYGGISFLIAGSTVSPIYYTLYCSQWDNIRMIYMSFEIISCFVVFAITIAPRFDQPHLRGIRASLFVFFGLFSAFPLCHFTFFPSYDTMFEFPIMNYVIGGAIYIFGAWIYSIRFPESIFPGKFDYFGHSHNLWHFLVLTAAFVHFYGSIELYHLRRNFECPA